MNMNTKTAWRIAGEEVASCNCAWGCPCQFNALPTHANCEALAAWQVREGQFGSTRLDGLRFARVFHWPGPIHEGNGTRQLIIDAGASAAQREALVELESGRQGGAIWEIFAAVCPNTLPTIQAALTVEIDRERRVARAVVPGVGELRTEPIKNPVSGEEHRARIVLPNGFEYKEAEVGNTVELRVATGPLAFQHRNTYAQLNAFDWTG